MKPPASLRSWQTTVAGILSAVGLVAQAVLELSEAPAKVRVVAALVNGITLAALGILARDNSKTSEDVGAPHAKPAAPAIGVSGAIQAPPDVDAEAIALAVTAALQAALAARKPEPLPVAIGAPTAAPAAPQDALPDATTPREGP